jgi:DNA replicative helicase MCM subunit Mcm2 (Cdc46/Mcm family)
MPRTFILSSDRYLTDKVTPGNRVKVVGVLSIMNRGIQTGNSNKQVK